jgi:hypothetical protein
MSIPVELPDLQAKTTEYGWAYLLTVRDDQTPHIVSVAASWDGDDLIMSVGGGTARNATARSIVSLCYPPSDADDYSLIVDGTAAPTGPPADAAADSQWLRFAPTGAVLHRSAQPGFVGSSTGCANDCLPVDGTTS